MAADEQLAARLRPVGDEVLHVRHVGEADLRHGRDGAAVAVAQIGGVLAETLGVGFRQAVALHEGHADDGAEELMQARIQRRGARDHESGVLKPKRRGDLASPDPVVERVNARGALLARGRHCRELRVDNVAGEGTFEAWLFDCSGADGAAEAVKEAGDRGEGCWLECLQVVYQGEDIAVEVGNTSAGPENPVFDHSLVDVSERKVGEHAICRFLRDGHVATGRSGYSARVEERDPFRWSSRAGGIIDCNYVRW